MSLDPHWYSTMFGVYYFAGCVVAFFATLIIIVYLLQQAGYLRESVTIEHYHDLGKFLFAFVFFWGYIAFSQYMLLWYANIPEEADLVRRRHGAHDRPSADVNGVESWRLVAACCSASSLIPFAGLLSRHVKRNAGLLVFWAVWLLVVPLRRHVSGSCCRRCGIGFNALDVVAIVTACWASAACSCAAWLRMLGGRTLRPDARPAAARVAGVPQYLKRRS